MEATLEKKPKKGCCQNVKYVFSHITAEPILFFFYLPNVMLILVTSNFYLDKACRVNLKLDDSICDGLATRNASMYNKTDEETVQKLVTTMNIWRNVCQSVLPVIFLAFIGSWSDKYKRLKPSLLFPAFGSIIKAIGLLLSVGLFYQINMEVAGAMEVIPSTILGGAPTATMGVNNYVSTVSASEMLTLRLGFVRLCSFVSYTLGTALGGILLQLIGYYGIFSMALIMYIISILYTVFCIKEIKTDRGTDQVSIFRTLKDFFNFRHVIGTAKITFQKREKNHRLRIMLLFLLTLLERGPQVGEANVVYLFTRLRFQWSEVEFSVYYIYHLILNVVGLMSLLVVLSRIFKVDDAVLGVIGCLSKVIFSIVAAFSPNSLVFYLAVLLDMFAIVTSVAIKSIIVKLVPKDEFGMTLSIISMFETLPVLLYGPLYNLVYKLTIDSLPGTFYLVGGGLTTPAVFIFLWFYYQHKKDKKEKSDLERTEADHKD